MSPTLHTGLRLFYPQILDKGKRAVRGKITRLFDLSIDVKYSSVPCVAMTLNVMTYNIRTLIIKD